MLDNYENKVSNYERKEDNILKMNKDAKEKISEFLLNKGKFE